MCSSNPLNMAFLGLGSGSVRRGMQSVTERTFGKPPEPPAPPTPPAQAEQSNPAVAAARKKERQRLAGQSGYRSTVMTGPMGAQGDANIGKTVLGG